MNQVQKNSVTNHYVPLCGKYNLPAASIPEEPSELIDVNRRNEILAELEESQAETIILLGDKPIKWFLSLVSDCKKTRLGEFGEEPETYGLKHSVNINGKTYTVMPLAHVRQGGSLGPHSDKWEQLHSNWAANMNSRK
jgi:hypothetical protein